MPTATTRKKKNTTSSEILYLAFELSLDKWKLAFATGLGDKIRVRTIPARDLEALQEEIGLAEKAFRLPASCPVVSCYEAGRDGFWLHHYLESESFTSYVVDPASIEVGRRGKNVKTDHLDVRKLLTMLIRYFAGEPGVWSVCHVPSSEDEDRRHLHRELKDLKAERTRHTNRIKGILISQGIRLEAFPRNFSQWLQKQRLWNRWPLPKGLKNRIEDEYRRRQLADEQIKRLELQQRRAIREEESAQLDQVRQLMRLTSVGEQTAWITVMEFFGWRGFRNRRQVGALAGYAPVPSQSGQADHDRGISKAGNRYIRALMVEFAWRWLRLQPKSALTRWYHRRFGKGGARQRKIGIVALARKLLIALWQFLEYGIVPEGATLKEVPV